MRYSNAILAALLCLSSSLALAQAPPAATASNWELKGLALGSTPADFIAKFPEAKCKPYADSVANVCRVYTTLADRKAILEAKYLSDKAVFIGFVNLSMDQAQAGVRALQEKFGKPTAVNELNVRYAKNGNYSFHIFSQPQWNDGDVSMMLLPVEWTDEKNLVSYSAVVLVDQKKHNDEWIPRSKGKFKMASADI